MTISLVRTHGSKAFPESFNDAHILGSYWFPSRSSKSMRERYPQVPNFFEFFQFLSIPAVLCSINKHFLKRMFFSLCRLQMMFIGNLSFPFMGTRTASPRGRYGERPQRDSVWRYICKNTTCWPATAHDVTTGVPQYKCRREDTSSASSSEACVRSMAQSLGDAVSRSPLGEPWLHT